MSEHEHVTTSELPEEPAAPAPRSRGVVAPIASAVAVVLVAGGGFAAWRFLSDSGPQPDEVLPATTFALATVDLDPSGGQKIEGLKALRKFPSLRSKLGKDTDTDLMQRMVDSALEDGKACKGLSYDRDFKPWIGQTMAVGGVQLGDGKTTWVAALEAADPDKARKAFGAVADCSADEGGDMGWTVSGDYVLMSDSQNHAEVIASAGQESPLAADAAYQKWTGEAGDAGVAGFYVSRKAPDAVAGLVRKAMKELVPTPGALTEADRKEMLDSLPPSMSQAEKDEFLQQMSSASEATSAPVDPDEIEKSLRESTKDFTGMAGVLRFADGGFELSVAAGGVRQDDAGNVAEQVGRLPADTMAALAIATPKDLATKIGDGVEKGALGMFLSPEMLKEAGIALPDDLEALLGSALSVSVGGDAPADLDAVKSASDLPFGLLVQTDPAKFQAAIGKVEKASGTTLAQLPATLVAGDDRVAVASSPSYADELVKGGGLADSKAFRDVVPHADKAAGIFFLQVDGEWRTAINKAATASGEKDAREAAANLDAFRALGVSSWVDGATSHGLVRVSLR